MRCPAILSQNNSKRIGFFIVYSTRFLPERINSRPTKYRIIAKIKNGIIPPTINHSVVDENIDPSLNLTLNKAQKREIKVAMSNTFGFGGHNACVLFKKLEE